MKTILFLSNVPAIELIHMFEGIIAVAQELKWNVQRIGGLGNAKTVKDILDFWKPQGCLVQCSTDPQIFPSALFRQIPHVFIDRDPALLKKSDLVVLHDSAETGSIAARELMSLGLEHFAYVRATRKSLFWCNDRYEAFRAALTLNGHDVTAVFEEIDPDRNRSHTALKAWLKTLPRPCGLFASNDRTAEIVLSAAAEIGISLPNDLPVIGVDNAVGICENASPTITSIAPEFAQAGRLAAELLKRKFAETSLAGVTLRYGQSGVVRRESMRRFRRNDPRVNRILEYVRLHAAEPDFSFERLEAAVGCTLRCAEMRFKELVGRTILDELHERRVEIAMSLLVRTKLRISEVASRSGFASLATFARVFNSQAGISPLAYRRRAHESHAAIPVT